MSKGFDMLRDYIEHDALCMRRRKCCDFEYELQQEFAALEAENAKLRELCSDLMGWIAFTTMGESVSEQTYCVLEDRMRELGIEVGE